MCLKIKLLGGFSVEGGAERAGRRFESQKVRALLAYLASHPEQPFSREQLCELLWPEEDSETARHNLRQALYSLRQGIGERAGGVIASDHHSLSLALGEGDSLDVADLEAAYHRGFTAAGEVVPAELGRVADLYRGDFLSGFTVRDSVPFENWLITEQERLRDMAVQALSALVDYFSTRGEYEPAIGHCHRLLEIDPLSEEAHHELIRHYVLSGRRPRAMLHYEELSALLDRELGVAPSAKTRRLYESIREGRLAAAGDGGGGELGRPPLAPFVPLVSRDGDLGELAESWRASTAGTCRVALVVGEPGVGKTRLARTFLGQLSARHRVSIVQGRCTDFAPWCSGDPLSGILRELTARLQERDGAAEPSDVPDDHLEGRLEAALEVALEAALARWLEPPAGGGSRMPPLALFLDDLHRASDETCEALLRLLDRFTDRPLWLLVTAELPYPPDGGALHRLAARRDVDTLRLERLGDAGVEAVSASLVDGDAARKDLALYLMHSSEGLPLAAVESLNALWDLGHLKPLGNGRWALEGPLEPVVEATEEDLRRLILSRVGELASSTRRILTLASVAGVTFDVELLQRAGREHLGVVEIGVESLLEHCLIRHYARRWNEDPRERDLVLWAQGARRGTFEFAHPRIRQTVYQDLPAERRKPLHADVARALAERHPDDGATIAARVAFHHLAAGRPADALPYLRAAAERALEQGLGQTAQRLVELGMEARSEAGAGEGSAGWDELARLCREEASAGRGAAAGGRSAPRR